MRRTQLCRSHRALPAARPPADTRAQCVFRHEPRQQCPGSKTAAAQDKQVSRAGCCGRVHGDMKDPLLTFPYAGQRNRDSVLLPSILIN